MKQNQVMIFKGKTKHVQLKFYELELLKQISIHRIMTAKSIHDFIQEMSHKLLSSGGITNRLTLLVREGVLTRQFLDVSVTRAPVLRSYYMLGIRGFHALVNCGYFSDDKESLEIYRKSRNSEIPSTHTDAMSILANRIFLVCQQGTDLESFQHFRGADAVIPNTDGEEQRFVKGGKFIPDWVYMNNKQFICIEMDTGSQSLHMITEKIHFYNKLNQKRFNKENGYSLILIFAVLDNSIGVVKSSKKDNRSKRIGSLKSHIANLNVDFSGIYVVSARRAPQVVKGLISFEQTFVNFEEKKEYWSLLIQKRLSKSAIYSISEKTLPTLMNHTNIQNWALTVIEIKMGSKVQSILLIMANEGSIITWRRMKYAMDYAKEWKKHFINNELVIIICYENEIAASVDVIGLEIHTKLYKTAMTVWEETIYNHMFMPPMLQMLGPYIQRWNR